MLAQSGMQAFYLVENLYECNANPFITSDGRVDLSGMKLSPAAGGSLQCSPRHAIAICV